MWNHVYFQMRKQMRRSGYASAQSDHYHNDILLFNRYIDIMCLFYQGSSLSLTAAEHAGRTHIWSNIRGAEFLVVRFI